MGQIHPINLQTVCHILDNLLSEENLVIGLTLQLTASFTHYNLVFEGSDHDKIGIGVNGRVKFSPQSSFIFQFDAPLKIKGITEQSNFDEMDQQNPNACHWV